MGVSWESFRLAQSRFREWTGDRQINKVADLARPLKP